MVTAIKGAMTNSFRTRMPAVDGDQANRIPAIALLSLLCDGSPTDRVKIVNEKKWKAQQKENEGKIYNG